MAAGGAGFGTGELTGVSGGRDSAARGGALSEDGNGVKTGGVGIETGGRGNGADTAAGGDTNGDDDC